MRIENINSLSNKSNLSSNRPSNQALIRFQTIFRPSPSPLSMRLLISLPIFGLMMEWLLPLQGLGDEKSTVILETLFILAVYLMLQGIFSIREWVWLPLNAYVILLLWSQLFGSNHPFTWLVEYMQDTLPRDIHMFLNTWHFREFSEETRVLLLLIGWAIMVYTVWMLVLYRRTVWLFGGATIIYLAVLESGLGQPVYDDMFRASIFIFTAQGMMLLLKLKNEEVMKTREKTQGVGSKLRFTRIAGWFFCVIFLAVSFPGLMRAGGELFPAREGSGLTIAEIFDKFADWSLSLPGEGVSVNSANVTGYGSLSQDLGGPLTPSRELFFTAKTPVPSYWRGEALQYYDGRRWIAGKMAGTSVEIDEDLSFLLEQRTDSKNPVVQKITLAAPPFSSLPVFSGGPVTKIIEVQGSDGHVLEPKITADSVSDSLRFQGEGGRIFSYTIEAELQSSPKRLKLSPDVPDPEPITDVYLQLPNTLPQRVRELGEHITAGMNGRYEKAMAVESYLEQKYAYTLNTTIPPAGLDFTDHFLFETKEGYCTHFATAMVVLLRTQGIPARYVMGFAPGEKIEGTTDTYRVTSEEAHAWVEVYFPGEGWAAFDPTPGFNAGMNPVSEQVASSGMDQNPLVRFVEILRSIPDFAYAWITGMKPLTAFVIVLLLLPIVLVPLFVGVRRKRAASAERSAPSLTERDQLIARSAKLWKKLEKKYGLMKPGITARAYIQSLHIEDEALRLEIQLFASRWERAAYMESSLSRTEKRQFLRQCRSIPKKLV